MYTPSKRSLTSQLGIAALVAGEGHFRGGLYDGRGGGEEGESALLTVSGSQLLTGHHTDTVGAVTEKHTGKYVHDRNQTYIIRTLTLGNIELSAG